MEYISVQIRVGLSITKPIDRTRLDFHEKVMRLLCPDEGTYTRVGLLNDTPFSHFDCQYSLNKLVTKISKELKALQDKTASSAKWCIIDFMDSEWLSIREVLLDHFFRSIPIIYESSGYQNIAILLPANPQNEAISMGQLQALEKQIENEKRTLVVVNSSGNIRMTGVAFQVPPNFYRRYRSLVNQLVENPEKRLMRKCVRRLGHFRTYDERSNEYACRDYSYDFAGGCDKEFRTLFFRWWRRNARDTKLILIDLQHNEPLRTALLSMREEDNVLEVERIDAVLRNPNYSREISGRHKKCVLVLDVVDSGKTMKLHIERLKSIGIDVVPKIFTAINLRGTKNSRQGSFSINGVLGMGPEDKPVDCIQCKLELPFTSAEEEQFDRIRAYDMLSMAQKAGYQPELEIEIPLQRIGYQMIPNFLNMLESYGNWISYKMIRLLSRENLGTVTLIHPAQSQSSAIARGVESLWGRENINSIAIDHELVKEAQSRGNDWTTIMSQQSQQTNSLRTVVETIRDLRYSTVFVIMDIFWGSGSTCTTMTKLLEYCGVKAFAYICLVDFHPEEHDTTHEGMQKMALYRWYTPSSSARGVPNRA